MHTHGVVGVSISSMHHTLSPSPSHHRSLGGVHSRLHGSAHSTVHVGRVVRV